MIYVNSMFSEGTIGHSTPASLIILRISAPFSSLRFISAFCAEGLLTASGKSLILNASLADVMRNSDGCSPLLGTMFSGDIHAMIPLTVFVPYSTIESQNSWSALVLFAGM